MPELMVCGDVIYSKSGFEMAEYHNRVKIHNKLMEQDLGVTDNNHLVPWVASVELPHPSLNNRILQHEAICGGKTGTQVLSIDVLLENPREKAIEIGTTIIHDL